MKKNYPNKELKVEETKEVIDETALVPEAEGWRCIRECEIPMAGHWKVNDKIFDPGLISIIKDNPNFEKIQEEN